MASAYQVKLLTSIPPMTPNHAELSASDPEPSARRVLYLYTYPFEHELAAFLAGERPSHVLRCAPELKGRGYNVDFVSCPAPMKSWFHRHLRAWSIWSAFVAAIVSWKYRSHVTILAVQEHVAIPTLMLRRLGIVRARVVVINIALLKPTNLSGRRRILWSRLLPVAARVVSYTRRQAQAVDDHFQLRDGVSVFLPLSIQVDWFRQSTWKGLHADSVIATGHAGRAYETLVEAAVELPECSIRILCSQDNVDRLANTRPVLPANVSVELGNLTHRQLADSLSESTCAVLPLVESEWSAGQTTLLELFACGLPVIVSRVESVADYLSTEVPTVRPEDSHALACAIRRVLADPGYQRQLSAGNREWAFRFDNDSVVPHLEEILFPVPSRGARLG